MDEKRSFGYCVECESEIVDDDDEECFVNEEGEVFCCLSCLLEHYRIHRLEM